MNLVTIATELMKLEQAELMGDDCAQYEIENLLDQVHNKYPIIGKKMDELMQKSNYGKTYFEVLSSAVKAVSR